VNGGSFAVTAAQRRTRGTSRTPRVAETGGPPRKQGICATAAPVRDVQPQCWCITRGSCGSCSASSRAAGKNRHGFTAPSTKGNVILQYCNLTRGRRTAHCRGEPGEVRVLHAGHAISRSSPRADAKRAKPDYFPRAAVALPQRHHRAPSASTFRAGGQLIFSACPEIEIVSAGGAVRKAAAR